MENFVIYETATNIVRFIESRKDGEPIVDDGFAFLPAGQDILPIDQYWIDNGILKTRPSQPSPFYYWNNTEWVLNNDSYIASETEIQKGIRDQLLLESDWTDTYSAPARLGEALYNEWQVYRQALRDVPQQNGFPLNIVWPIQPT